MLKKNITIVLIALFIVLIGIIFFYIQNNYIYEEVSPVYAVPTDAAIIFQISNPEKSRSTLFKNTNFYSDLEKFNLFNSISKVNRFIDSSEVIKNEFMTTLLERNIIISLHPGENEQTNWFISVPLKSNNEERGIKKHIAQLQPDADKVKVDGCTIFLLHKDINLPISVCATVYNGLFLISNSQLLIERSVAQRNDNKSLLDNEPFRKIHKTSQLSNAVSVYVNFSQTSNITRQLFNSVNIDPSFVSRITSWSELDLDIHNDAVSLSGFSISDDKSLFSNLFQGITTKKSEIAQIIPDDTKFLMSYSFNEVDRFRDNLIDLSSSVVNSKEYKIESFRFESERGYKFENLLFSFIDKECALIYTEPNALNAGGNRFLVFNTQGQSKTLESINQINQSQLNIDEPAVLIELDDQTKFPVYKGFSLKLMNLFLGNIFPVVPSEYFTFYRNYIIFANTPAELQSFMYSTVLNKSLSTDSYYSKFIENFSFQENFFLFAEIPSIYQYAEKSLNSSVFYPTDDQTDALSRFYGVGVQLSSTQDMIYSSVYANYTPQRDKEPRTIWQSRLDSTIIGKPALVDNHNTGEKEILVQDNRNNLYLINSLGRVLWKRPLEGPVLSEIYQIDFYKNNKLQYLFNTAEKLYLIDRNGNHVAKYPLTLPSNATNGLSVFDYDNNKDYRIFVALNDNRVYLFDKNGNRNPGWNPLQTEGIVTSQVQYFCVGDKDYIVFSDQYRNYILDRRGEDRVIPKPGFIRNKKSLFFIEGEGSKASLVTTARDGSLAKISLSSGECSLKQLFDCPEDHFFTLIDENNNSSSYLFVTEKQMVSYNREDKKVLEVLFDEPVLVWADIYQFSNNDIKFGIVEKNSGKINLISNDGKNYHGFPLKGNSRFSIGFLKSSVYRFNLIVGGDHNFLNNYCIE